MMWFSFINLIDLVGQVCISTTPRSEVSCKLRYGREGNNATSAFVQPSSSWTEYIQLCATTGTHWCARTNGPRTWPGLPENSGRYR